MQVTHDQKLLIAIGRSRKASQWQNKEFLWSELLDKLSTTTRTRESVAEYAVISKNDRDTVKDVGGFVGGYLKNGKRNNASVVNRCLLCLDIDNADPDVFDDLDMTFHQRLCALLNAQPHRRRRCACGSLSRLSRTVTPDEYAAVARRVADELTLSRFDQTTFEAARLHVLAEHAGRRRVRVSATPTRPSSTRTRSWLPTPTARRFPLPTTRPLEEKVRAKVSKQEDPLQKRGIIGAYCRAHSIHDVLENVLSDRYHPTEDDNRYTFVGGSTTGGLVIYDDKYAFSHHATDPAGGHLCNAFDLTRRHLFTPGQACATGEMIPDERASMKAMQEYAAGDEATKRQLAEERQKQVEDEFTPLTLTSRPRSSHRPRLGINLEYDKQGR